jgi:hypothetical protein
MAGDVILNNATVTFASVTLNVTQSVPPELLDRLGQLDEKLSSVLKNEGIEMHSIQEIRQDLADTKGVISQLVGFIQQNDADKAALRQQIADLIAKSSADDAAKAALQTEIDAAFDEAEDVENTARAGLPGVPPVGGTPLVPSYADRASFDSAVAGYSGPEQVTVDGTEAKAGSTPSLDYFSHSADGSVSTTGPSD